MAKRIFYLKSCSTCQRILKEVSPDESFEFREIKSDPVSEKELDEMKNLAGSYEALFSRKSQKYRALNLHEKELNEQDYKKLILEEYTFLKRPVFLFTNRIFIGNTKPTIEGLKEYLNDQK